MDSVERIEFRTGKYRTDEFRYGHSEGHDYPDADKPVPAAVFDVDNVSTKSQKKVRDALVSLEGKR